tara:strand:- start:296 stop:778 length:483 start_codon:yes stop_codon:yes gene_type:complete
MSNPMYGQNKYDNAANAKVGSFIYASGGAALSLDQEDSGKTIVIAGGTAGATACSLPHINGVDGLEFTFLLKAANGTGDWDIDAKDGVDFFAGSIVSVEGTNDVGIDFAVASSHDQLSLAASKGTPGDRIHITSADGIWWIDGVTNDQDGWAVGTASANT